MIDLQPASPPLDGQLRFVRYAFMPNRLHYCGGGDNQTLFEYGVEQIVDAGLTAMLKKFSGALPYLKLIARSNNIPDPFDSRVVEAYWIGNELLDRVEVRQLYDSLAERFGKQLQGTTRDWVLGKAPAGAHPHHNFHVFDVHSRVGELENTLETMDNCRISWGKVVSVNGAELMVERQPLVLLEGKLALGSAQQVQVVRQMEARGFADNATAGDWVSIHWGWVCETLNPQQLANLQRHTTHHLALANQTI